MIGNSVVIIKHVLHFHIKFNSLILSVWVYHGQPQKLRILSKTGRQLTNNFLYVLSYLFLQEK